MSRPTVERRLAALLAADAVGYSRLMAANEPATIAALDEARAVFREHVEGDQGRVVDTAGDSVLAESSSGGGAARAGGVGATRREKNERCLSPSVALRARTTRSLRLD